MSRIKILFADNQDKFKVGFRLRHLIKKAVRGTLDYEKFTMPVEVSVTFTDNEGIHELNKEYRDVDRPTDVLSFPMYDMKHGDMPPEDERCVLGDIVLSLEKADEQAKEFGHSFERETAFLTVHSMLHLLGYDHMLSEADDLDQRRRQTEIMNNIGLPR